MATIDHSRSARTRRGIATRVVGVPLLALVLGSAGAAAAETPAAEDTTIEVRVRRSGGPVERTSFRGPRRHPRGIAEPARDERAEAFELPEAFPELVAWAVDRFEQAGLDLPSMRVVYHDGDRARCDGSLGLHQVAAEVDLVDVCSTAPLPTQAIVLHEMAHAWAAHFLDSERRDAFQEVRGWEHWHDYEAAAWKDNGAEQAAEIMVWGLIDRPHNLHRLDRIGCAELETAYRALTGRAPLHGYRSTCDA